jgi:phospholipid transport system substrate-binding protein
MTSSIRFYSGVFSTVNLIALLVLAFTTPVQAQMESPDSVVRSAAEDVLESMEGRRDYLEAHPVELRQLVDTIFLPRFDQSYAAYLVLARHGRAATADQRSRFTEALYQYILKRYANGLLSFTSDRLQILPFEGEEDQERATVRTFVVLNDGSRIPVNYDLRLGDTGWRVYDIAIDGISYLRNLRSQLGEEIERNGLESVITRLIADGTGAEDDTA